MDYNTWTDVIGVLAICILLLPLLVFGLQIVLTTVTAEKLRKFYARLVVDWFKLP